MVTFPPNLPDYIGSPKFQGHRVPFSPGFKLNVATERDYKKEGHDTFLNSISTRHPGYADTQDTVEVQASALWMPEGGDTSIYFLVRNIVQ